MLEGSTFTCVWNIFVSFFLYVHLVWLVESMTPFSDLIPSLALLLLLSCHASKYSMPWTNKPHSHCTSFTWTCLFMKICEFVLFVNKIAHSHRLLLDTYYIVNIWFSLDFTFFLTIVARKWDELQWMKPTIFHVLFMDYTTNEIELHENGKLRVCECVFGVKNFIFIQYKMLLECLNRACWLQEYVLWSAKTSKSKWILTMV